MFFAMNLITLAHLGEAQGIIDVLNLKRLRPDTFQGENCLLIITGEGPFEALAKTALNISAFNINKVINLGIAGSLSMDLRPGDFVSVRTVYLISEEKPQFKSFPSLPQGVDCLTSFERILDPNKALKFRGMGHLVDREAWGVAFAAKSAGIPFESYKVISDMAGTMDACELVRQKAPIFSQILADKIHELIKPTESSQSEAVPKIPGFHFTFTTAHKFKGLISSLAIKKDLPEEKILEEVNVKQFLEEDLLPKERTRRLMEKMELELDPIKAKIRSVAQTLEKNFHTAGAQINFDPSWENPKAKILIEAGSDKELQEKLENLKKVSLNPFTDLMEGKF